MGFGKQFVQNGGKENKPKWAPYVFSRYVIYDGNFLGFFKLLSPHVVVVWSPFIKNDGIYSFILSPYTMKELRSKFPPSHFAMLQQML